MLTWIISNLATIIICAALAGIVALIVIKAVRDRKKGKSSCGCGCSDCPMGGKCHQKG